MEQLEAIKKKIKSTEALGSIVRTMKILAAVSIRQYEKSLLSLGHYRETIELGLQVVLKSYKNAVPYFNHKGNSSKKTGIIVLGTDLGMCGQFNEQIASFLDSSLSKFNLIKEEILLLTIGDKLNIRLTDRDYPIAAHLNFPSSYSAGITPLLNEILTAIDNWNSMFNLTQVFLVYNKPIGDSISYEQHLHILLPLDDNYLNSLRNRPWISRSLPIFKSDRKKLLSSLIHNLLFSELYYAYIGSLTCENAARLLAMQTAEKNIDEHHEELKSEFNRQRQDSITSELLDIIAGFETLTK